MAAGLDRVGREVVRILVEKKASSEDIRGAIHRLEKTDTRLWSYDRNIQLVEELAGRGYPKTAKYLAERIKDNSPARA